MNVSLSPELERFVHEKVSSGHYTSASEVVREGLRLLIAKERLTPLKEAEIRRKIEEGLEDARAGRLVDGKTVFAGIREKSRRRREKA